MMNRIPLLGLAITLGVAISMPVLAVEKNDLGVKSGAMMGKEGDDKGGGKKGAMMMGKEGDDKGGGKKGAMMMGKEGDDKGGGKKGAMMTPSSVGGINQNAIGKGTLMDKGGQKMQGLQK